MAPKTPIKNEPIDLSKQKIFTPERNPITPVKLVDRQQAEPWTPTANLKMLISAASPDIRDREKKKGLFRPIENKDDAFTDSLQLDVVGDSAVDEFEKQRPSRKQKSLGLLCQKFLARYPSYPLSTEKTTISLDEVAVSLGMYHQITCRPISSHSGKPVSSGRPKSSDSFSLSKGWALNGKNRGASRVSSCHQISHPYA
nr:transcription factor E2F7-like [Mirounga angustirostris]